MVIFEEPTGFNGIMNMQDMTSSVCAGATVGTSGRLRDTRDKKVYWVTKLADNNCWMTQNLDLDLYNDVNLSSSDTDIASMWTPTTTQKNTPSFSTSANSVQSFDPGYYVYTTPTNQGNCTGSSLDGCGGWMSILNGIWKSSSDPTFTTAVNESAGIYNAHYLIGNYYSYAAATAGTAPSAAGTATSSICPKGWQLPTSNSTTASKSFGYLLTQYGLQSNVTASGNDLRLAPLYFVYGGYVTGSSLYNAGYEGRCWSSTANNGTQAYTLRFNTSINTSDNWNRYIGLSVRCVAR